MTEPAYLLLERACARVALEGPLALLEQVTSHCQGYFAIKPIVTMPVGVWRVSSLGADNEQPSGECFRSVVRSEPTRFVFYDLDRKSLTLASESPKWLPIFCCRLIRDVLRWQLLEAGGLFLQAGLVKVGDAGIALVGPPRSGKTTTALALVGREGGTLVADNDLCVAYKPPSSVSGLGWPRSICIRTDTVPILKEWWPTFSEMADCFAHPNNRHESSETREFLYMLPGEMAVLTKNPVLAQTPVSCFVFPEFCDGDDAKPELVRLSGDEAANRLAASWDFLAERKVGQRSGCALKGRRNWPSMCFNPFLVDAFSIPEPDQLFSEVRQLATCLPSYRLSQHLSQVTLSSNMIVHRISAMGI